VSRTRLILDVITPRRSYRYGDAHRAQCAELHLPAGRGPHPVVVTIHGGSWAAGYTKLVMRGVVGDLARRGWAVWNIEYRRVGRGQGGGWPLTFVDVAAAIDHLRSVDAPLDLEQVTLLGHSAGGHLALWAAGREGLPGDAPGANPALSPIAAIAQAGVNDLATCYRETPGGAVGWLMGGSPDRFPERYAIADPISRVPLALPVLLVHGTEDHTVSVRRSRNYAAAAADAGGTVELVELAGDDGGHRRHVDPDSAAWAVVTRWLERRAGDPAAGHRVGLGSDADE
jgi:acetyl esterase/lipase